MAQSPGSRFIAEEARARQAYRSETEFVTEDEAADSAPPTTDSGRVAEPHPMSARHGAKRVLQAIFFCVALAGAGSAIPVWVPAESPLVTVAVVLVGVAGFITASYIPAKN